MWMRLAILALLAVLILPFEPDLGLPRPWFMAGLDKVRREKLIALRDEIHSDRLARRGR